MNNIVENLTTIKERIRTACLQAGRQESEVRLLLATKTVPADKIAAAIAAGETLIGENKVQELRDKFDALQSLPHETHFIGHLQSNKIKEVIRYTSCIQSIDRIDLAEKLNTRLVAENKTIDIFLQVNTSFEASKFGTEPGQAVAMAKQLQQFSQLRLKGLMTIGLFSTDLTRVAQCYRLLKTLQGEIQGSGIPVPELSMGMSGDLETAIREGATMVRVGTAIFGQRIYPDSYYWNEQQSAQ